MWHVFFLTRLCCLCDVPVVVSEEEMGTPSLQYDWQVLERKKPQHKTVSKKGMFNIQYEQNHCSWTCGDDHVL